MAFGISKEARDAAIVAGNLDCADCRSDVQNLIVKLYEVAVEMEIQKRDCRLWKLSTFALLISGCVIFWYLVSFSSNCA